MNIAKDIPIAAVRFGIEPIKITRNEFSKFIVLRYNLVRMYKRNINIIENIVIIFDLLFVIFIITANVLRIYVIAVRFEFILNLENIS